MVIIEGNFLLYDVINKLCYIIMLLMNISISLSMLVVVINKENYGFPKMHQEQACLQ